MVCASDTMSKISRRLCVRIFSFLDECVSTNFEMILLQNRSQNKKVVWDPHVSLLMAQQTRRSMHWSRCKDTGFVYKRHDIKDYPPVVCACFFVCLDECVSTNLKLILLQNWFQNEIDKINQMNSLRKIISPAIPIWYSFHFETVVTTVH